MEVHFKIIGFILIGLSALHLIFPRYFHWKTELKSLSLINRQMMFVHTSFIGIIVFMMGILCLTSSGALVDTGLGKTVSLGLGAFWTMRLLVQLFVYST
jgi:hypothetical protein